MKREADAGAGRAVDSHLGKDNTVIPTALTVQPHYDKDGIAIHCGDCLDVMPSLTTASVDAIITDPPYHLPVHSYVAKRGARYERHLPDTSVVRWFFKHVFAELFRILKPTGNIYVFCDGQSYPIFYDLMIAHCKRVRPLIWDKLLSYNGYTWRHQHEIIAWGERNESKSIRTADGDILKCRGVLQTDRNHPAEKPVELLKRLIAKHPATEVILDPFMGSGSTAVAARSLGKKYIGVELNEAFAEIATKRAKATAVDPTIPTAGTRYGSHYLKSSSRVRPA